MNPTPAATFNFWTLLFSGFAFIGIFYSVNLLIRKRHDTRNTILGMYLLLQSITILEYVFYWTNLIYSFPIMCELSLLFPLLYGPLLVIYLNRSFGNDKVLKEYGYHFIPFLVLLAFKLPFYFSSSEFKLYHTHNILFGRYFAYYPWFMLWHLSVYTVILTLLVRNQSGVGSMRLWAKWLVGFFIAFIVFSFFYYFLIHLNALTVQSDYFISLANCATIFFIAWYGQGFGGVADGRGIVDSILSPSYREKSVSSNEMIIEVTKVTEAQRKAELSEEVKYQNSGLPKSVAIKLAEDLETLMQNEKLYQQNDLSLEVLAEKLNSTKHFVSQVMNQNFRANFFEYINLKRIEEAKQLLRTTPREELNVIEIAYSVGFNNKGTFNSVFKKITGVTPTEFRKQSQQLLNPRSN